MKKYLVIISIHSLPKEGDVPSTNIDAFHRAFQSTPSPRRETMLAKTSSAVIDISIHSLPKEGDTIAAIEMLSREKFQSTPSPRRETIDILELLISLNHFNPLPPQGGRPWKRRNGTKIWKFQSTPSPRRETCTSFGVSRDWLISIHSLPKEGDVCQAHFKQVKMHFNPLPPQGGRQ